MKKQIDGLEWTADRPKFPGSYIVRCGAAYQEVSVAREDGELITIAGPCVRLVRNYSRHCEWSGPFSRHIAGTEE